MEKVTIKNLTNHIYIGDDHELKNADLRAKAGQEIIVSVSKAKQLFRDFPNNWAVIEAVDATATELNSIKEQSLARANGGRKVVGENKNPIIKTVPGPSILQQFLTSVKEGEIKTEKIAADAISLLKVLPFANFVSAEMYKDDIKLFTGELGADIKKNIRYILVDKEDKSIDIRKVKEEKKEEKSIDKKIEEDHEKEDDEVPEVVIKKSKTIDPEEDLGLDDVDELDDEDPDEKQSKKKRKTRRMKDEEDDDDDED